MAVRGFGQPNVRNPSSSHLEPDLGGALIGIADSMKRKKGEKEIILEAEAKSRYTKRVSEFLTNNPQITEPAELQKALRSIGEEEERTLKELAPDRVGAFGAWAAAKEQLNVNPLLTEKRKKLIKKTLSTVVAREAEIMGSLAGLSKDVGSGNPSMATAALAVAQNELAEFDALSMSLEPDEREIRSKKLREAAQEMYLRSNLSRLLLDPDRFAIDKFQSSVNNRTDWMDDEKTVRFSEHLRPGTISDIIKSYQNAKHNRHTRIDAALVATRKEDERIEDAALSEYRREAMFRDGSGFYPVTEDIIGRAKVDPRIIDPQKVMDLRESLNKNADERGESVNATITERQAARVVSFDTAAWNADTPLQVLQISQQVTSAGLKNPSDPEYLTPDQIARLETALANHLRVKREEEQFLTDEQKENRKRIKDHVIRPMLSKAGLLEGGVIALSIFEEQDIVRIRDMADDIESLIMVNGITGEAELNAYSELFSEYILSQRLETVSKGSKDSVYITKYTNWGSKERREGDIKTLILAIASKGYGRDTTEQQWFNVVNPKHSGHLFFDPKTGMLDKAASIKRLEEILGEDTAEEYWNVVVRPNLSYSRLLRATSMSTEFASLQEERDARVAAEFTGTKPPSGPR